MKPLRSHPVVPLASMYFFLLTYSASAQVPGTIERFTSQAVSETWQVYDYNDGGYHTPVWVGGADPHIDYAMSGASAINVFANTSASGGKLTGDMSSGVAGIALELRIDNFPQFDYIDILILSVSDNKFYQSLAREADDIGTGGWTTINVPFSETWYYYNTTSGEFEAVDLTEGALNNVAEIGFRVGRLPGSTGSDLIGCDDVRLVPELVEPQLAQGSWTPPEFEFELLPGHTYDVEEGTNVAGWLPYSGNTNLTGSGMHSFPIGTDPGSRTYRVKARPYYTE